jgi:hypothetical protein
MITRVLRRAFLIVAGSVVLAAFSATDALADVNVANHSRPFDIVFPAGQVCAGFGLGVWVDGDHQRVFREFKDADGNVVRTLSAGRGFDLTFANVATKDTFSLRGNGSVQKTTFNSDGSTTLDMTGHTVIFLYPTDITAGPSTTLYVGRVVMTNTKDAESEIVSSSGTKLDICAALA